MIDLFYFLVLFKTTYLSSNILRPRFLTKRYHFASRFSKKINSAKYWLRFSSQRRAGNSLQVVLKAHFRLTLCTKVQFHTGLAYIIFNISIDKRVSITIRRYLASFQQPLGYGIASCHYQNNLHNTG